MAVTVDRGAMLAYRQVQLDGAATGDREPLRRVLVLTLAVHWLYTRAHTPSLDSGMDQGRARGSMVAHARPPCLPSKPLEPVKSCRGCTNPNWALEPA